MSIAETVESVRTVVSSDNLRDALTACMLSVSTNDTLPVLMTVQIEKRDGELVLRSTDRFRLTRVTIKLDAGDMPSPNWVVLVASDDVKRVLSTIPKPKRGLSLPVSLSWLDDGGRDYSGRVVNGLSVDTGETGMRVQSYDAGEFPRTDGLIPSDDSDTVETGEIAFDPKQLIDLCKMPRGKGESVRLRMRGTNKGVMSVWGDDTVRYEHLLMPKRSVV